MLVTSAFHEHRPSAKRIVVVGGGIIGITVAISLLNDGHEVTVIDPGIAELRCSYGNAGSLSPGSVAPLAMPGVMTQVPGWLLDSRAPLYVSNDYWLRAAPWLAKFVLSSRKDKVEKISHALKELLGTSIELYRELLNEVGAQDLIIQKGQLQLYPSHAAREKDAAVWKLRRDREVKVVEIERGEILDLEPAVGERYVCGIYLPNEGMITNPGRLVDRLTKYFAASGGRVVSSKVTGFLQGPNGVCGVLSPSGPNRADLVVVAAGAWSNELSSQLGDKLPLQTQRGYHAMLTCPSVTINRPVVAADRKYFATPMEQGLRIAGTVEFDSLDREPNYDRARTLLKSVSELLPGVNTQDVSMWMGHRPCLPDSLPVVDRGTSDRNVIYAFGNGHLGLTAAPMMAKLVTSLVRETEAEIDIEAFSVRRFTAGTMSPFNP